MSNIVSLIVILITVIAHTAPVVNAAQFNIEQSWDIAEVPSDFPVQFCLLTASERHYVAYYDTQRRMTVASRTLNSNDWQYQVLPTQVGWDSHNYITMAVDGDGNLHVSGNMHVDPLIYFRTEKPENITTLKTSLMCGMQEDKVTYPRFLEDPQGNLLFNYRHGASGNGMQFFNRYDLNRRNWSRLHDTPLLYGKGECNAYPLGPVRGPDGWFHLVWVWRDTPDCATNHHLSYARSQDLVHWESVFGEMIELPMELRQETLWVDPVPSGGGMINGGQRLFFDTDNRPIITYHKSDANGYMQIYAARPEANRWVRHLLTDWNKPVVFNGGGSMGFIGIHISTLSRVEPDLLTMTYQHCHYGHGRLVIDEKTLRPVNKQIQFTQKYPKELNHLQSSFKGMQIRRAEDMANADSKTVRYLLQWETLGANRDRPRTPPLPEPSMLRLYKLTAAEN